MKGEGYVNIKELLMIQSILSYFMAWATNRTSFLPFIDNVAKAKICLYVWGDIFCFKTERMVLVRADKPEIYFKGKTNNNNNKTLI